MDKCYSWQTMDEREIKKIVVCGESYVYNKKSITKCICVVNNCGDRDEIWIIEIDKETGSEFKRYNIRYVESIIWK